MLLDMLVMVRDVGWWQSRRILCRSLQWPGYHPSALWLRFVTTLVQLL